MENLFTAEVWTGILAVASAIVLLSNAAEKIGKAIQAARAPSQQLSKRMTEIEERMSAAEKKLEKGQEHFEAIDASNRVTQVALLALLDHGIDGNNIKQMQSAKEELQTHLINR